MNRDAVSNRLTHCSAFCSFAERRANFQKKRLTTRRQSRNITVPPSITPAQLYTKPRRPPWAATFSATMAMSGSGGKKDSTIARITGAMGPSAKAFQQGLPEFQRSQLVEPAYHRHFHPACSFPLIFL